MPHRKIQTTLVQKWITKVTVWNLKEYTTLKIAAIDISPQQSAYRQHLLWSKKATCFSCTGTIIIIRFTEVHEEII